MTFVPALPLTGVAGFRFLERTEAAQKEAQAATPEIAREIQYFKDNIGGVGSADDLLADRRLLQVALTAYGLETEIDKPLFVKQVLESDVAQENSFANRLNDRRWSDLARDFGFGDPGAGREQTPLQIAVNLRYEGATAEFQPEARTLIDAFSLEHFRREAPKLTTAQDLVNDSLTLDVALKAFDIDRSAYSDATIISFIENGVNTSGGGTEFQEQFGSELFKWSSFAQAFQGLSTGGTVTQRSRFGLEIEQALIAQGFAYETEQSVANADPGKLTRADLNAALTTLDGVTDAQQIVDDPTLLKVVKVAFGLEDEFVSNTQIVSILNGGADGPALAQSNFGWSSLAAAFDRNFNGGVQTTLADYERAVEIEITTNRLEALPTDPQPPAPPAVDAADLDYFNAAIRSIQSPEALVADKRLLDVALRAFGLENENRSDAFLIDILTEDPYASTSFVNVLGDQRWIDFAQAVTPPSDGAGLGRNVIQFELEGRLTELEAPQSDIDYVRRNMNLVNSPLDLVLDPTLMDIALSAFNLPKDTFSSTFVINALISDPGDPSSFVNQLNDARWVDFAETFGEGGGGGNVGLDSFQTEVLDRFQDRSFENAVGSVNEDLRVALNFERAIGDVASSPAVAEAGWLQLLGDPPLRQLIEGVFNLPPEFAQIELDSQVSTLQERAQILFGGDDPSVFLDAANVDTAITRFLGRAETASTGQSTAATLLQQTVTLARSGFDTRV